MCDRSVVNRDDILKKNRKKEGQGGMVNTPISILSSPKLPLSKGKLVGPRFAPLDSVP